MSVEEILEKVYTLKDDFEEIVKDNPAPDEDEMNRLNEIMETVGKCYDNLIKDHSYDEDISCFDIVEDIMDDMEETISILS